MSYDARDMQGKVAVANNSQDELFCLYGQRFPVDF